MEIGTVDLIFEKETVIFYRLAKKIDKDIILKKPLSEPESPENVNKNYDSEQHWLAVWDKERYGLMNKGDTVQFDFRSSRFHPTMYQGKKCLKNVRNLNVKHIEKIEG